MPGINDLSTTIASVSALSMVTERFVEIVKGMIPFLHQTATGTKELWRNTALRLLAVIGGVLTVWLAHDQLGDLINNLWNQHKVGGSIALGLLAGGGSGLWNAALKYVGAVKDLRQTDAEVQTAMVKLP